MRSLDSLGWRPLTETVAEATGQESRSNPVLPSTGWVRGNAVLTAWTGLVLLVLGVAELLTLFDVRGLITWHVAIGALLVPPALMKTGSTGWRRGALLPRPPGVPASPGRRRCCSASSARRSWSSTLALLGTGILLILLGEGERAAELFSVVGFRRRLDAPWHQVVVHRRGASDRGSDLCMGHDYPVASGRTRSRSGRQRRRQRRVRAPGPARRVRGRRPSCRTWYGMTKDCAAVRPRRPFRECDRASHGAVAARGQDSARGRGLARARAGTYDVHAVCADARWQRGRDSNPRLTSLPATAFKAVPIGHSGTPPVPRLPGTGAECSQCALG